MQYKLISPIVKNSTLEQIFYNRGFNNIEDIEHYLNTTDEDIIDPKVITNIEDGAKMLIKHIAENHDVLLQIDSDADGFTSSAILMNYLNCLFPSFVQNHIRYWVHDSKAHGIDEMGVSDTVKLVIAPDSSSNEYDKHKELAEKGIDVLIIDHHNAPEVSPYACVINNQLCDYDNKDLSGAGMVYKFCCYIDSLLGTDYANQYLDLASLGIIADVMDLRHFETKQMITQGLKNIRNPFLKLVIDNDERYFPKGKPISIKSVAWSIGPLVNAVTRIGSIEEKLLLFESMLEYMAYEQIPSTKRGCKGQTETRVEQSARTCKNVKSRQDKSRDNLVAQVERRIEEDDLLGNKVLAIRLGETSALTKNITGLVANKIMSKYQRPVLLLSRVEELEEDGNMSVSWAGSGRNYPVDELPSLQEFLLESELVNYAQGHDNALGVSIPYDNYHEFVDYANEKLKDVKFEVKHDVDYIYDMTNNYNIQDIGNDISSLAAMKHIWGQGIQEPVLAFKGLKLTPANLQLMGAKKNTWKITTNGSLGFIKFNSSEEEFEDLLEPYGHVVIDIIGTCEINDWNSAPQINIIDYNIISRQKYDF